METPLYNSPNFFFAHSQYLKNHPRSSSIPIHKHSEKAVAAPSSHSLQWTQKCIDEKLTTMNCSDLNMKCSSISETKKLSIILGVQRSGPAISKNGLFRSVGFSNLMEQSFRRMKPAAMLLASTPNIHQPLPSNTKIFSMTVPKELNYGNR
jgi:hypothetical protein